MTGGVSVVITAHNEAQNIHATLQDVAQQAPDEVVLVDDRSTDGTSDQARAAQLPGLVLMPSRHDAASPLTPRQQALDLAFRTARGQVLLTLDADSRLRPGWAAAMAGPVLAGRADAVAGPVAFSGAGFLPRWQSCDAAYYLTVCRIMSALGMRGAALFGNFAFRADLYGGPCTFAAIGPTVTEDFALSRCLQGQGARLRYAGRAALVTVRGVATFRDLVARTLRVTRAPPTALGAVLTLWPLTLLAALLWTLATGVGGWLLLARYGAGAALVVYGVLRNGRAADAWAAPLYEPFAFVLAGAALVAKMRGQAVHWGGLTHD